MRSASCLSNRPVLIRSETMIGFDVAPVAPNLRLAATRSGSMLSSQSFVPVAISDSSGVIRLLLPVRVVSLRFSLQWYSRRQSQARTHSGIAFARKHCVTIRDRSCRIIFDCRQS